MKLSLFIIMFILFSTLASAATIHGSVYDFSLDRAQNVKLTISTEPEQQLIAPNGSYSFNVSPGSYIIVAEQLERGQVVATAEENITISTEGSYIRDIILFPYFGEEEAILNETEAISVESIVEERPSLINYVIVGALMVIIAVLIFLFLKIKKIPKEIKPEIRIQKIEKEEKKPELPKDLQELVDFIKSQDGRSTQKDIRRQFPLSEAKISLMIADLEQRGIVQKIKKGRGNIIILKE